MKPTKVGYIFYINAHISYVHFHKKMKKMKK